MDEKEALLVDLREELKGIRKELKETRELLDYRFLPLLPLTSFWEVGVAFVGAGVALLALILWRVW